MSCPRHVPAPPAGLWGMNVRYSGTSAAVHAPRRLARPPSGRAALRGKLPARMATPRTALSARSLALAFAIAALAACAATLVEGTVAGVAVLVASASALFLLVARRQAAAARRETAEGLVRLQAIIDSMADGVIFV